MMEGVSPRGLLARRPPQARPAHRLLRRQPHLDRRPHRPRLHRGRRQALRGLRLARAARRRTATTSTRSTAAIAGGRGRAERPSLVVVRTDHRLRQPQQGRAPPRRTASRSGPRRPTATKKNLGWPLEPTFLVPDEARAPFDEAPERGAGSWSGVERAARRATARPIPTSAAELERRGSRQAARRLGGRRSRPSSRATSRSPPAPPRARCSTRIAAKPAGARGRLGGPHALEQHRHQGARRLRGRPHAEGRNLHFGVREHGMGAILNGIALSAALDPLRRHLPHLLRLHAPADPPGGADEAARSIYVFTHDSIFLGEDGPTHQPIEQLAALRAIPGLTVLRPADANETAEAWRVAIEHRHGPVAFALTRQNLPILAETAEKAREGVARGRLRPPRARRRAAPEMILLATGSEVWVAARSRQAARRARASARPRREPALLGALRRASPRTTGIRCCRRGPQAPRHRSRLPMGWHKYVG